MNWSWGAIQTLTEESLQQDIFDLGGSPPPKPKKKSLGGRDAFVEALSYGKILQSQQWQRNRMVIEVCMINSLSSLLSQLWSPQPSQPVSPCKNTNHPNYPQKHSTWIPEKPIPKYPSPSQLMPYFIYFTYQTHPIHHKQHSGISALRKTSFQEVGRRWYERKQRVSGRADAAPENSAKVKGERRRRCGWLLWGSWEDWLG